MYNSCTGTTFTELSEMRPQTLGPSFVPRSLSGNAASKISRYSILNVHCAPEACIRTCTFIPQCGNRSKSNVNTQCWRVYVWCAWCVSWCVCAVGVAAGYNGRLGRRMGKPAIPAPGGGCQQGLCFRTKGGRLVSSSTILIADAFHEDCGHIYIATSLISAIGRSKCPVNGTRLLYSN